jgi:group I intron endonuclease
MSKLLNRTWIVYEHISPSGKIYVGITSQRVKVRWQNGGGYIHCKVFYRSILKYGWENFQHNIVASNLGEQTAKNIEKDLIKFYKDRNISYNITDGGDATVGIPCSTILREKIGTLWRGKIIPQDIRNKMSKSHLGMKLSQEHKDNIRRSKIGNINGNKVVLQFDKEGNFIAKYSSAVEVARSIGSIPNSVTRCCRGEVKTLHKFRFVYEKDYKIDN